MWFMKSYGGLAHMRGISSSELAQWTVKMGFMNERKIILGRSKSRPLLTCFMNPFKTSILGVLDDFPYNQNQNKSGAEGSISPPTSQTLFKLLTTHHTKLR
jgi:hypothetical protein